MIDNVVALGAEKPRPDRYLNVKLIEQLDLIKPLNGCSSKGHHIVFAEYKINKDSSYFDMKPGICSCGLYWKILANNETSKLKDYYITGKMPKNI